MRVCRSDAVNELVNVGDVLPAVSSGDGPNAYNSSGNSDPVD
jgi:hypothetical protein